MTKVCQTCGALFSRPTYERDAQWAARKYCSRKCSAVAHPPPHNVVPIPLEERFWAKVDKSGGPDACWPWTGSRDGHGYGMVHVKNRENGRLPTHTDRAHRVTLRLTKGDIPSGMIACHHCDNPPCCNPAHVYAGTKRTNVEDRERRKRGIHFGRRPAYD